MKQTRLILAATVLFMLQQAKISARIADLDGGPMGVKRVAMCVGSPIPYVSTPPKDSLLPNWVQIDLGAVYPVEAVKLYPYFQDEGGPGAHSHNFPLRFRIEASGDETFAHPYTVTDQTASDFESYPLEIKTYKLPQPAQARYVRLTVLKPDVFELWRFEVISGGKDVAEEKTLSDSNNGNPGKHDLLRPQRPVGENVWFDHPEQVTATETWKPVKAPLQTPRSGVTVGGLFKQTFDKNIHYLLNSFSVHDMAHNFLVRAGKDAGEFEGPSSWFTRGLGGSIAGRYLMGAGNALRWQSNEELRRRMNELVNVIDECATPEGYIYGYPEHTVLQGQNHAYARGWLSQGLVEAGIAGNPKAWPLLRRGGDWFNSSPYLPEIMFRVPIGNQGMVANSRTYLNTDIGVPADIQVLQRYFQLNFWLDQLIDRDPSAIWQYQYERVHSYLIIVLNAYMDMYMATGDKYYLNAMHGAWDIFHEHFTHTGGSISVIESYTFPPRQFPPKSYHLRMSTGELCGNVFWAVFNEQLRVLYPDDGEKYVAEIEKSIYNVGIANQDRNNGNIRYHARLVNEKENGGCGGSCCEGQGTRFYGMLPEFVYKIAGDGLYIDLFNESSIEWEQDGKKLSLHQHSEFPLSPEVKLHFELAAPVKSKIRIRVPSWAASKMNILVNGKKAAAGTAGYYVTLNRTWKNNDVVSFTLPMGFRLTKYAGVTDDFAGKEAYALEYGPLLMGLAGDEVKNGIFNLPFAANELTAKLKPVAGKPLHFSITEIDSSIEYVPYYEIHNETFTCYPFLNEK
ncbi:MAG: glycoside hydrolase family 127 protein [Dysgonamonadaceae bacterium]|nr:glycoside hydrolase family 127 protein [Dysgonamonadaceae bacterium]